MKPAPNTHTYGTYSANSAFLAAICSSMVAGGLSGSSVPQSVEYFSCEEISVSTRSRQFWILAISVSSFVDVCTVQLQDQCTCNAISPRGGTATAATRKGNPARRP